MRLLVSLAVAGLMAAGTTARADDPPEGSIGIKVKVDDGKLVVESTIKDSPAEKAGLKADDVIVKIDDHAVKEKDLTQEDLEAAVKEIVKHKPGDKIKVTVKREGKEKSIDVTVGKRSEIFPKDKDKE
jgi:C-terminal processing protease CtpA/Prc